MIWLSRARGLTRWSPRQWALMAEAWLALLVARVAVRFLRLPEVLDRLQRWSRFRAAPAESATLARAVWRAAALHALPMLCLPRSLALAWMLARRGQPCEIIIGAQPKGGTLDAHAWIEQDGVPINSPPDSAETFPVLLRHPVT
jgi:transglutaminase superfamily protein